MKRNILFLHLKKIVKYLLSYKVSWKFIFADVITDENMLAQSVVILHLSNKNCLRIIFDTHVKEILI